MNNAPTHTPAGNPNPNINQNTGQPSNPSPSKDAVDGILLFLQYLLLVQILQSQSDLDCGSSYDTPKLIFRKASENL